MAYHCCRASDGFVDTFWERFLARRKRLRGGFKSWISPRQERTGAIFDALSRLKGGYAAATSA